MMYNSKKIFFLFVIMASTCLFAKTKYYVSVNGNDSNPGSRSKPFATIKRALSEARTISGTVVIYLHEGMYYLNEPIVFSPADSRKENESLTIKNEKNQNVTISGSKKLNLNWETYKNGIWKAKVTQDLIFDCLLVNGQIQHAARYPNYDPKAQYYGGTAEDVISKERVTNWKSPEGGYIHALHPSLWGDSHYKIIGKDDKGDLQLVGGWQNNRPMGMHQKYRFVENIFEELDVENEWYYDKKAKMLYYYPPKNLDIKKAKFETPQITHLFEFRGTEAIPVKNINILGLYLTQTLRTFMENKEPLLRSDWTIYRGGAVLFDGAVNCTLKDCTLSELGGNAVFFNNFNRNCQVTDCKISEIGASAFCFVGDPNAVRSASFQYYQFVPLDQMDRTPGPKTNNYPVDCKVYNNLMFNLGTVEKQSAAVQLSMCQSITVSHNTIYDISRAGINVNEGTWGGHIIEFNDIFNTVKESGDHGSFNSWGRDRYWHFDKKLMDSIVENNFELAMLDVVKPIVIQNNRLRCDHGWDIDLDDGSSNYIIKNNLCLNGGIKLREGVNRVVENNIMVNNTFHPHVWFKNSNDVFKHNIVMKGYLPIQIDVWGKETDYNVFPDAVSLKEAQDRGTDRHSIYGGQDFINPGKGDFRIKKGSKVFTTGFKNFDMDSFGVVSPKLKALAKKVIFPVVAKIKDLDYDKEAIVDFMGAKLKDLNTDGEQSATGMDSKRGVLVLEIKSETAFSKRLRLNDVILALNGRPIHTLKDLFNVQMSVMESSTEILIFRNQKEVRLRVEMEVKD